MLLTQAKIPKKIREFYIRDYFVREMFVAPCLIYRIGLGSRLCIITIRLGKFRFESVAVKKIEVLKYKIKGRGVLFPLK